MYVDIVVHYFTSFFSFYFCTSFLWCSPTEATIHNMAAWCSDAVSWWGPLREFFFYKFHLFTNYNLNAERAWTISFLNFCEVCVCALCIAAGLTIPSSRYTKKKRVTTWFSFSCTQMSECLCSFDDVITVYNTPCLDSVALNRYELHTKNNLKKSKSCTHYDIHNNNFLKNSELCKNIWTWEKH